MRHYILYIIVCLVCSFQVSAQTHTISRADTASQEKPDSSEVVFSSDTLKSTIMQVHSIEKEYNRQRDSLRHAYTSRRNQLMNKLGTVRDTPEALKDSLLAKTKLDSIRHSLKTLEGQYRNAMSKIAQATEGKLRALPPTSQVVEHLRIIDASATDLAMPSLSTKFPDIINQSASTVNFPEINSNLTGNVGEELKEVTSQASSISEVASNGKNIDKLVDENATKIDGVKEMTEAAKIPALPGADTEKQMREMAMKEIKSAAMNHFADKKEVLNKTMENVSKYKNKYSSVSSLKEIPSRSKNLMKGKTALERTIPGLQLQVSAKGKAIMVDFNPYVSYRFTHKITGSIGWNQRVAYDKDLHKIENSLTIFGGRMALEYKLKRGFAPKLETELMNTSIPSYLQKPEGPRRAWVPGAFAGIKKDYKIYGNLKGTATIMFRVFNYNNMSPYPDVVNARMGVEYSLKGHKKKTSKAEKNESN